MDGKTYFSARDLTTRFPITSQTLRNWEKQGKIPPAGRTIGKHRRYTQEHVQAIEMMLQPPTTL